ncbi:MAG TPA: homocysteine S-methyltransferase family protein [Terriglobales bacterium]|nr:homocysteine S-methyltransferase family protein [Terriglobales bacterium]
MSSKESKKSILELSRQRVVLFDGAMGTMLFSYGLPFGTPPELWNLSHPEIILKVHQEYIRAGADIIQTNTFGASSLKLKKSGNEKKMEKLNEAAVKLARTACPDGKYVAGNIGPTGEFLEPVGKAKYKQLKEAFSEQAEVLCSAGVDLFSIETMFDLREALAAVEGVRQVSTLPLFVCLTFEKKTKGYFTLMGDEVSSSLKKLEQAGADVVGANCTLGSKDMVRLASVIRKSTKLPIIVQPNAGMPKLVKGKTVYLQKPSSFASDVLKIVKSGANFVGGCCGTTPEFIKTIKKRITALEYKPSGLS